MDDGTGLIGTYLFTVTVLEEFRMNRALVFGIAMFFAVVGIALVGGEKSSAVAGLGCHGCGGGCGGLFSRLHSRCCGEPCCGTPAPEPACCGCGGLFSRLCNRCCGEPACEPEPCCGCGGLFSRLRHRCCGEKPCCGEPAPSCGGSMAPAPGAAPAAPPAPAAPAKEEKAPKNG
jgi:hypothetical protein